MEKRYDERNWTPEGRRKAGIKHSFIFPSLHSLVFQLHP